MKLREELRDEFAAAALMGLLASSGDVPWPDRDACLGYAQYAYNLADAMLAHRDAHPLSAESPTQPRL